MAPAYKLTYFDIKGRAESIRFLFKYGGIDFEEVSVKFQDWPQLKSSTYCHNFTADESHKGRNRSNSLSTETPLGHLPILEHNGIQVSQSVAICRYLGTIVKLAGKDAWENLEIDSVVDTFCDLASKIFSAHPLRAKNPEKRKVLMEVVLNEKIPFYLTRFDKIVARNNGHLALSRLTWADLFFAGLCPCLDTMMDLNVLEKYANLQALRNKVEALPGIKEWLEDRPPMDGTYTEKTVKSVLAKLSLVKKK